MDIEPNNRRGRHDSLFKVLFLVINPRPEWTKERTMISPPLGLAYIVSETVRHGYDCNIVDMRVEPKTDEKLIQILMETHYDVVALGELTHSYFLVKPLLKLIRDASPESLIVVGNSIASSHPQLLLENTETDVAVIGPGEEIFLEILERIKTGRDLSGVRGTAYKQGDEIVHEELRKAPKDIDSIPYPNWDLFDVEAYIHSAQNYNNPAALPTFSDEKVKKINRPFVIQYSRGCAYRCTFCFESLYYKFQPIATHSPEVFIAEMRRLKGKYNINYLFFWDETSFYSPKSAAPLIDALIEADLGIKFSASVRVGFLRDKDIDFAHKLAQAGCAQMSYSLESGSPIILESMNKKIEPEWFYEQKRVLDKAGIISNTNLVLGYPEETKETLGETFNICYDNDIFPSAGFLLPVPGTVMYNYALENGYIVDEEEYITNVRDRQHLILNMTKMSDEELVGTTLYHMKRIRDKLGLDLSNENLICNTKLNKEAAGHPLI